MESLSQYPRETVKLMDDDFVNDSPPNEREEAAEWVASKMTSYLLESIEQFAKPSVSGFEKFFSLRRKELDEYLNLEIDEHYTRRLLHLIPEMVERTMQLAQMIPRKMPSFATNLYLREATRSYIFGSFQASVALSRVAVEQGLREAISEKARLTKPRFYDLIASAMEHHLLDDDAGKLATQVELAGNRVLHGKPSSENQSLKVLSAARNVLLHLYGVGGQE